MAQMRMVCLTAWVAIIICVSVDAKPTSYTKKLNHNAISKNFHKTERQQDEVDQIGIENPQSKLLVLDQVANDQAPSQNGNPPFLTHNRVKRAAVYGRRQGQKHIMRIPSTKPFVRDPNSSAPPPDSFDEDVFESFEANREAFLELLSDHEKAPKQKKHSNHQSKIQLRYNDETKRYTMFEQSDEF